jgi:hypothetical protein
MPVVMSSPTIDSWENLKTSSPPSLNVIDRDRLYDIFELLNCYLFWFLFYSEKACYGKYLPAFERSFIRSTKSSRNDGFILHCCSIQR